MDLRQLLRTLRLRWKFTVVMVLLGVLGAGYFTSIVPPTYQSTVRVFVSATATKSFSPVNTFYQGVYVLQRIESYAPLATDPKVTSGVDAEVGQELKPGQKAPLIKAVIVPNAGIIEIRATHSDPKIARDFALSDAEHLVALIDNLETTRRVRGASTVPPVTSRVAGGASLDATPISPNGPVNLIVGAILGLLIGAGGALLREVSDRSVRSPADLGAITRSAVMAVMPLDAGVALHPLISDESGTVERVEAFQVLRTNLQFTNLDHRRQMIVVSSAVRGEGKTITATDLAISVARAGRRVLLIDCDFRRPGVARLLGLENAVGLLSVLLDKATLEESVQEHETGLHVLATGPQPPNPAEILATRAMRDLLNAARAEYDVVILDAPPLLPVTDPAVLAPLADGVLLVTRHGHTSERQVQQSVEQLDTAGAKILGVVLNMAPRSMVETFGYSDGYAAAYGPGSSAGMRGKDKPARRFRRAPVNVHSIRQAFRASLNWVVPVLMLMVLTLMGSTSPLIGAFLIVVTFLTILVLTISLVRAGTLFMIVGMFLAPMNDLRLGNSQVTISDLVFIMALFLLGPTVIRNRIRVPTLFIFGLALLLTMGVIASIASTMPGTSAGQVARLVVGAFALPVFFMAWRPPTTAVVRFACAYVLGTVVSVGYGLAHGPVIGDPRYIGFTTHPNFFGLSCLLAASLTPYIVSMVRPGYRWIFWGASLICAYGIWISGSRAALLVLGMLVVVYPFIERSVRAGVAVVAAVLGMLLLASRLVQADTTNNALGRLFGNGSAQGSDAARKDLLVSTFEQFKQHPLLGNGFDGTIGAHNIYLQVAVAVGIFGLFGYLVVMWTALRPLFWRGTAHRLCYPVLAYLAFGPLTNTLWERLIWAVVSLTFAVNTRKPGGAVASDEEPARDLVVAR